MTQIARKTLPAYVGIGGGQESMTTDRTAEDIEHLREEFYAYVIMHIGKDLTVAEMRALMQPVAQSNLAFRVDEALKKVATWYPLEKKQG